MDKDRIPVKPPVPTLRSLRSSNKPDPNKITSSLNKNSTVIESTTATKPVPSISGTLSIKTYSTGMEDTLSVAKVKVPKSSKDQSPTPRATMTNVQRNLTSSSKGKGRQVDPPQEPDTASGIAGDKEEEVMRELQDLRQRSSPERSIGTPPFLSTCILI
jgi:hypothetical protein